MPSVQAISTAVLAFIALSNAASLTMSDGGAAGGCTGSTGCCIPTCDVMVTDSLGGGDGVVRWTGTCQSNEQNPSGTQDVGDGHQMTWLRDESGQAVIDVFRKSDKKYDRWTIKGCSSPGAGGSQCSPTGGGCSDIVQVLFGAQG